MAWSEADLQRLRARYADDPGGRMHDPRLAKVAERVFSRGGRPAPFMGVPTFLTAPFRQVDPEVPQGDATTNTAHAGAQMLFETLRLMVFSPSGWPA